MADGVTRALQRLPVRYAGPGGAAAVLRDGALLESHAWGWADSAQRIPFTPATLFRICSITKQFTCGLLLDRIGDPAALDGAVRDTLARLDGPAPTARDLCHNQSGLRDYWAVAMLCGAAVEGAFGEAEAQRLIRGTRSLQFRPGTRSSYCNHNFRILGDLLAAREGCGFDALLRRHLFDRAGMPSAFLAADTRAMPDGTVGYEGTPADGFREAVNRILWTGDAGIGASLTDMIAWEAFIDATRDAADGLYRRLAAPVGFADGTAASYGFGLGRGQAAGRAITGHGGGLRGWRSYRLHCAAERVSVVVLFNHMADARAAALELFAALLDAPAPDPPGAPVDPGWEGAFIEPETGLSVLLQPAGPRLRLCYGTADELIDPAAPEANGGTRLWRDGDAVWMARPGENQRSRLLPIPPEAGPIEGRFDCPELEATLQVVSAGGVPCAAFSGFLGAGEMQALRHVAGDVWRLPCPRALDYHPPGDWTLRFRRGPDGRAAAVEVGCWLARRLLFSAPG